MKPGRGKEMLSYIFPVQVEARSGSFNNFLEITLSKGRYLLNSKDTNYSFGGLHVIFQNTFRDIKIDTLNISNCLLLGLGGGSVIQILREKYLMDMPITAVEIDPVVIQLGHKYFNFDYYKDLSIVNADAYCYVKDCENIYDLIIIDIFINDEVPEKFHTREFISCLDSIAHRNTIILFNKMLGGKSSKSNHDNLIREMEKAFGTVGFLSYKVYGIENEIICVNAGGLNKNKMKVEEGYC